MSRDYFDQVNDWSLKFNGTKMADDEIVQEFAIRGVEARAAMLHRIEEAEEPGEVTDLRKAANRMNLKRKLNNIHHTLRLAGK